MPDARDSRRLHPPLMIINISRRLERLPERDSDGAWGEDKEEEKGPQKLFSIFNRLLFFPSHQII